MLQIKENKEPRFDMWDNEFVIWEDNGNLYSIRVQYDAVPKDPRRGTPNITTMACWSERHDLGDDIQDKEPEDFWQRLVRENVSENEIVAAAKKGMLPGIRLAKCRGREKAGLYNIYETYQWRSPLGNSEPEERLEYEEVAEDSVAQYLMDDLTINHCMTLMEPYAEWIPLWLYDHSGITISCGARTGQYADRWDSGCVGWIVALKKTVMTETTEYVLDENGERIKVEFKHEGAPSTWAYKTRKLTDETWRARAIEVMKSDVELYNQFITGDTYGYMLYEAEPVPDDEEPDWNEVESTLGYFGTDIFENGIVRDVGCGLKEAILTGAYKTGEAKSCVQVHYVFE